MKHTINVILKAIVNDTDDQLLNFGTKIGKLYTNYGLPIDMALAQLDCTQEQKVSVLIGAQNWLIEHKRNSGATDKAISRQRKTNVDTMEHFISEGETGIY